MLRDSPYFSVTSTTVRSPNVTYHNSSNEMVISKQNIYYFTVEIAYASYLIFTNPIGIYVYDNQTLLDSIPEHPFCDSLVSVNSSVHNIIYY